MHRKRKPNTRLARNLASTFSDGCANNFCMAKKTMKMEVTDREFCQMVSEAAFTNPFSEQRYELDLKIAGYFEGEPERARLLRRAVSERVQKLESHGQAELRFYPGEDKAMMRNVFLFEVYHRFYEPLDKLIADQIKAGDQPCPVPFAGEALAILERRGFSTEEASRFFSIFFQLRRAFHFINHGLTGRSPCMKALRRHLWNNVFTHDVRWYDRYLWNRMEDFSTLLLGETGTGKGTAAAAIGRSGFIPYDEKKGRFAGSFTHCFISLNLSQYPEALIESELFGHKKGAFTGAIEAHQGLFARCSPYGSIFLDEIGEVAPPVQIKLLQVLQERTFSPVGAHEKLRFSGRVIAATNRSLESLRETKTFRDDFFYRLCSDIILVPSLRQRLQETRSELDLLLEHVMCRMTGEAAPELLAMVRSVIRESVGDDYPWPGNVREFEQAVRRILVTRTYEGEKSPSGRDLRARLFAGMDNGSLDADAVLSAYCALLYERHGTFEEVARRTNLDRRTVKKYWEQQTAK